VITQWHNNANLVWRFFNPLRIHAKLLTCTQIDFSAGVGRLSFALFKMITEKLKSNNVLIKCVLHEGAIFIGAGN